MNMKDKKVLKDMLIELSMVKSDFRRSQFYMAPRFTAEYPIQDIKLCGSPVTLQYDMKRIKDYINDNNRSKIFYK